MQNKAKFLTIAQASEILQISPDTLRRWEDRGIVTPHRTRGGSRRYTLLDLKIAKLKRKVKQDYKGHSRDFKIAFITSLLWILALLVFYFVVPIFTRPTNPDQQINTFLNKKNLIP